MLDHSLGSQRLVQLVGVCPGHGFEHGISPSGQLDAHGTPIDASGQATDKRDLCPDRAAHVVQDLGRQHTCIHRHILTWLQRFSATPKRPIGIVP
jgi:hypothetical protein